jgi:hypothetical protein
LSQPNSLPRAQLTVGLTSLLPALGAAAAAFGLLGVLFLLPYPLRDLQYPLGWGAATYAAKANAVAESGLTLLGTVRSAGALLLAVLLRVTGQNAFTLVAMVAVVLAGVAGLGAAGMLRAAFGVGAAWVPVFAFLTWAAFVKNGIMSFHFDNLVNTALILPGFAAALAYTGWREGAVATTLLFMGAGLAHWPFHIFSMAVFVSALVLAAVIPAGGSSAGSRIRQAVPLLAAAAVSVVLVALTFLSISPTGWYGARPQAIGERLRERLGRRLRDPAFYLALPLTAIGILGATATPAPPGGVAARRLFLALMGMWAAVTAVAAAATVLGYPTAGDRLLLFLFPVAILAGVGLWWVARWLARGALGRAGPLAGGTAVVLVVGGFGFLTEQWWVARESPIPTEAVRQASGAARYLAEVAPGRQAVFILSQPRGPAWHVIQALLPGDQLGRSFPYFGTPERFLAGKPSARIRSRPPPPALAFGADPRTLGPDPVGIVIQRYNQQRWEEVLESNPLAIVSSGVLVLIGPVPPTPVPAPPALRADLGVGNLILVGAFLLLLLLATGGGWATALLPGDVLLRVLLAPGLGVATIVLAALLWDRVGLSFAGPLGALPLVLSALGGWVLAVGRSRARRPRQAPGGPDGRAR